MTEHPPQEIGAGENWVASVVGAIRDSKYWDSSAIFITWDDWGGWYDHVPPLQVDRDGYGFRVPCLIVSPYARHGLVDHTLADFTSILKFIETIHSLPPLASRDASASDLLEAFDFSMIRLDVPLVLAGQKSFNNVLTTITASVIMVMILLMFILSHELSYITRRIHRILPRSQKGYRSELAEHLRRPVS